MKKRLAASGVLLFSFATSAVRGQDFKPEMRPVVAHTSWTARDGAPANIAAIAQTTDGYLWLGAPLGLYRFDGLQFADYPITRLDTHLPSSDIQALSPDSQGGLWIGFRLSGGISYLARDGAVTGYDTHNGLGPNSAQSIVVRGDRSVWAIGDYKLLHLKGNHWEDFGALHGLPSDQLASLYFDKKGNIWTSARHKLFILRPGHETFELYATPTFLIVDYAEAPDGELWISDAWHVVRPLVVSDPQLSISGYGYVRMLFDPSGTLWMARDYRGVSHVSVARSAAQLRQVISEPDLSSEQTNSIFRDHSGNIWVGTSRGLDRFQHSVLERLSNTRVEYYPSLAADPRGGLWIATLAHPAIHAVGSHLTPMGPETGSSPIVCDEHGRLWLVDPFRNQLTRYDGSNVQRILVPAAVHEASATSIGIDVDGAVLVTFDKSGLWRFNGVWTQVQDPSFPSEDPLSIFSDPDHRLWLGYADSHIAMRDSLGSHLLSGPQMGDLGTVLAFAMAHGKLWAAGANGLAFFDHGVFHNVSLRKEGVLRGVSGVVEDAAGDLWLNASTGIIRIPTSELDHAIGGATPMDYDLLNERQGVRGTATQVKPTPSAIIAKDGTIWFSTSGEVLSIDPSKPSLRSSSPSLTIQNVSVDGVPIMDREHPIARIRASAATLRELEIDYIGIDLDAPEKVSYRYMLEGEDLTWHEAGARRQAFFTNLKPRDYRFRLLATNGRGQWVELATPLLVTITPAFYETVWFYVLAGVFVLSLLYIAYLLRVRAVTRRLRDRLKERSDERLRIARELHDTLLQSIHGLMLRIHFATEALPDHEPARASLQTALSRADDVFLETRRRVEYLRDEIPESTDFADHITKLAEELEMQKTMKFRVVETGQRQPLNPIVHAELIRIAREALINTLHHSGAATAEVALTYASAYFIMKCRDTGSGLPPTILASGKRDGHWGLIGMRERAATIEARLQLWSATGGGTEIELRIPARKAYLYPSTRFLWLQRLLQLRRDATGQDLRPPL